MPSQSLSNASHTSVVDCWFWLQTIPPMLHAVVPAAQMPCRPVLQFAPPPGLFSSAVPSQSLSRPSHVSLLGLLVGLHCSEPPEHAVMPAAHTPGEPVLHGTPPPGLPS